jgi:hypothetical protein
MISARRRAAILPRDARLDSDYPDANGEDRDAIPANSRRLRFEPVVRQKWP